MSAVPLAPAEALQVRTARREVAVGEDFSFEVVLTANPAAPLASLELTFPGFTATAPATTAKATPASLAKRALGALAGSPGVKAGGGIGAGSP